MKPRKDRPWRLGNREELDRWRDKHRGDRMLDERLLAWLMQLLLKPIIPDATPIAGASASVSAGVPDTEITVVWTLDLANHEVVLLRIWDLDDLESGGTTLAPQA